MEKPYVVVYLSELLIFVIGELFHWNATNEETLHAGEVFKTSDNCSTMIFH